MISGITLGDLVVQKGVASTHEWSVAQTLTTLNWNLTGVASAKVCMQTWLISRLYPAKNHLTNLGSTPQGPIPRKKIYTMFKNNNHNKIEIH